jgi:hypothetical protein
MSAPAFSVMAAVAWSAADWISKAYTTPDDPTHVARNSVSCPFPAVASITTSPGEIAARRRVWM